LRITERIQINQQPISDSEFSIVYDRVKAAARDLVAMGELPWHPSFFEVLTGMMFEYFAGAGVELAVVEVGMGGRLDATNVVEPVLSVISDIDFDHQKFLGDTLPEIAREKAGIMRPRGTVVLLPQHPQVNETLGREIMERNARPVSAVKNMPPLTPAAENLLPGIAFTVGDNRFPLNVMGEEIEVDFPLLGRHQSRNLALAITAAEELNDKGFRIGAQAIAAGIRNTRWPGRFQVIPPEAGSPEMVLDVAHNPAGAWALRSALSTFYEGRRLTFVFGAMRDKAIREIAGILFPIADHVIAAHADSPRAASPAEIAEEASHTGADIVQEPVVNAAVDRARALAGERGVVVVTGSIYIVGEAMAFANVAPARQTV
jgi:dihydrofolate synthase/folylpolyglutamate synthase